MLCEMKRELYFWSLWKLLLAFYILHTSRFRVAQNNVCRAYKDSLLNPKFLATSDPPIQSHTRRRNEACRFMLSSDSICSIFFCWETQTIIFSLESGGNETWDVDKKKFHSTRYFCALASSLWTELSLFFRLYIFWKFSLISEGALVTQLLLYPKGSVKLKSATRLMNIESIY